MNFSDNLKKIRKENNLSQEQIAEQLGVSRQSVSKWESGQAYPEMDKMIQLCQIFNLNIDDLLNQDIKEVNNSKQSKININKFVDDFLDYITKTIDMFSSMKFKEKVKCLFEQAIIMGIIALILLVVGSIGAFVLRNMLSILPHYVSNPIFNVFESLYLVFCLILGVILLLHIFKVRYLDYYVIVKDVGCDVETKEESVDSGCEEKLEEKESRKIVLEKKKDKIVIRDPEHSGYKFISGLLRCLLFMIKTVACFMTFLFCISLIVFVVCLIVSFMFIKTGLMFLGVLLGIISAVIINLIILNILYNFIISKKVLKTRLSVSFVVALILLGVGIGFGMIGITKFDVVDDMSDEYYSEVVENIEMTDNLLLFGDFEYIESDNKDLRIVTNTSEFYDITIENDNNEYHFYLYNSIENFMKYVRQQIKDINNRKIVDYSNYKITVYTTKENIEILEMNMKNYEHEQSDHQNIIDDYERQINELNDKLCMFDESSCY